MAKSCARPPTGWLCTRAGGHKGPCAAVRDPRIVEVFPPGTLESEMDAQMIALALAHLAVERPGWRWALGDLATRHHLKPLFDAFVETSEQPR